MFQKKGKGRCREPEKQFQGCVLTAHKSTYMHASIPVCTHHTHTFIHTHILHTHTHILTHTNTHTHTLTYTHTKTHTHTRTHTKNEYTGMNEAEQNTS